MRQIFQSIKRRYVDPQYPFRDRLYFLFGTAGLLSAFAAFVAAIFSGLPRIAAAASLMSFFVMLVLMGVSFRMRDISVNRVICSIFLNFFMFPALFWVTGGINCGMVFYFILGLSVAALILEGKTRLIVLTLALLFDMLNLDLGFRYPDIACPLNYEERWGDTVSSFCIVAVFIIAVILIMSLEYQKEHDKVQRQAITDGLTLLYNQRHLFETLEEMSQRGGAASLMMFDLDDFKKINDTYGHQRGDQVLCRFAAILREKSELAFRYGGEEFVIVLPGCGLGEAVRVAEAIRLSALHDGELAGLTGGRFSVSGGVAQHVDGMTAEEWIKLADQNLYAAKAAGKNRVIG